VGVGFWGWRVDGAVGSRGVIGGLGPGWCWGWGRLASVGVSGGAVAGAGAVILVVVVIAAGAVVALERGDAVVDVGHDGVEHDGGVEDTDAVAREVAEALDVHAEVVDETIALDIRGCGVVAAVAGGEGRDEEQLYAGGSCLDEGFQGPVGLFEIAAEMSALIGLEGEWLVFDEWGRPGRAAGEGMV